jgi:hypothetical protein
MTREEEERRRTPWLRAAARIRALVRAGAPRRAIHTALGESFVAAVKRWTTHPVFEGEGVPDGMPDEPPQAGLGLEVTEATRTLRQLRALNSIAGPCGVGKTVAAVDWLDRYRHHEPPVWRGQECRFLRAPTFARTDRFIDTAVESLLRARLLVIDDLGVEHADGRGWLQGFLEEVIDTRYGDDLPMTLTTNMTPTDFALRYGDRIIDRIREVGTWTNLTARMRPELTP